MVYGKEGGTAAAGLPGYINIVIGKNKGPEWNHVTIIEQKKAHPKMKCKYCQHEFVDGARFLGGLLPPFRHRA
eukprot:936305-Pelagomonas_calceolata.AAC.1